MTIQENDILKCYVIGVAIMTIILLFASLCFGEMDLTKAVIHHTASHDVSAEEIDRWHKKRGWDGIGYHFVIRANGDIEKGRSIYKKGAHARGRNHYIGIALTGYDVFTDEQIKSLKQLLKNWGIKHIEPHHEQCPGKGIDLKKLLDK